MRRYSTVLYSLLSPAVVQYCIVQYSTVLCTVQNTVLVELKNTAELSTCDMHWFDSMQMHTLELILLLQ